MQIDQTAEGTVHREYTRVTRSWPYRMPEGYRFPSTPRWPDEPYGLGEALYHAYLDWRASTGLAAFAAYTRGDLARCRELLLRIRSTYGDELRRALIIDDQDGYLRDVIDPALLGDFTQLHAQDIAPFLSDFERATIAAEAGDYQ